MLPRLHFFLFERLPRAGIEIIIATNSAEAPAPMIRDAIAPVLGLPTVRGRATEAPAAAPVGAKEPPAAVAALLRDLFSPATAAMFRYRKDSLIAGTTAALYDFSVEREHSHWRVQVASQSMFPAYKGSVWIVEDITEQRKAEEELQRVLAEQQALLNNVVVGIQFTRERRTVRCNRRYEEMFGYAAGTAVGAPTRDVYFTEHEYEQVAAS